MSQEAGKMIDDDITPASETQPGRRATKCWTPSTTAKDCALAPSSFFILSCPPYPTTTTTTTMAKPTLLQSLLNRPSQSYAHYAEKDYHSAKQDFARAAASASSSSRPNSRASTSSEPTQERARPSQYQSTRRSLDVSRRLVHFNCVLFAAL